MHSVDLMPNGPIGKGNLGPFSGPQLHAPQHPTTVACALSRDLRTFTIAFDETRGPGEAPYLSHAKVRDVLAAARRHVDRPTGILAVDDCTACPGIFVQACGDSPGRADGC